MAVVALGPVGLMAVAGSKLRETGTIIGVDAVPARRELAEFYGTAITINPAKEDAVERIMKLTGGGGVDSAIEALGAEITFQNAIKVTKAGGTISNVGYHCEGEFVGIPRLAWGVGMAEKTIKSSLCYWRTINVNAGTMDA